MKQLLILLITIMSSASAICQETGKFKLEIKTYAEDTALRDILQFERIEYFNIKLSSRELIGKSFCITVQEIWDGELKNTKTVLNSIDFPGQLKTLKDSALSFRVIGKRTDDNKLKMRLNFPFMSTTQQFDATNSDAYSLRPIADKSEYKFGEKFYLMTYLLPYQKDNIQYYCAVERSGKNILTWGKEFGIKHYLIFEMEVK